MLAPPWGVGAPSSEKSMIRHCEGITINFGTHTQNVNVSIQQNPLPDKGLISILPMSIPNDVPIIHYEFMR